MLALPKDKIWKLALTGAVALLSIGAVAWFYAYGQWQDYQQHQAQIVELKKNIAEAHRLASTVSQTATMRLQMQQFIDEHQANMVSGDQFAWVIREISLLAESQPVRDVTTQPGNAVPHARKPRFQWYVTRLECVGDYDQIGAFIQELENHFPEAEIRSLTIGATGSPAVHRATLDLALLVRPVLESNNAPPAPTAEPKS